MRRIFPSPPPCSGRSRPLRRGAVLVVLGLFACRGETPTSGRDTGCALDRGACTVATAWGEMRVELTPRPIPVLQPVRAELRFAQPVEVAARLDLNGVDMDMGPNLVNATAVDDRTRVAQLLVPVCLTGAMRWRLSVELREAGRSERLAFTFAAGGR